MEEKLAWNPSRGRSCQTSDSQWRSAWGGEVGSVVRRLAEKCKPSHRLKCKQLSAARQLPPSLFTKIQLSSCYALLQTNQETHEAPELQAHSYTQETFPEKTPPMRARGTQMQIQKRVYTKARQLTHCSVLKSTVRHRSCTKSTVQWKIPHT